MARFGRHLEFHKADRIGWLRAAVMGANDGIVSTASLIVGVAAAHTDRGAILLSGTAGLVAGAMSMAAGEYVSVSSQADTEKADLARETKELANDPAGELDELKKIYVERGLDDALASRVAEQLMARDALRSHARDELGITDTGTARPVQAALASAGTFTVGAILPLLMVFILNEQQLITGVSVASLASLITLGVVSARLGGSSALRGAARVGFWGALAMAATALIGNLFGTVAA